MIKAQMSPAAKDRFIFEQFIPLLKKRIEEKYPHAFLPHTLPAEEAKRYNPNIYPLYAKACNRLLRMTTSFNFPGEPGNYNFLGDMYADLSKTEQDPILWMALNIDLG